MPKHLQIAAACLVIAAAVMLEVRAAETSNSPELRLTVTNGQVQVSVGLLPHVASFALEASTNLLGEFINKTSGRAFTDLLSRKQEFFRGRISLISSNDLLSAVALNRLAYGPTPDEIERIKTIGPQAFIDEQLAPEKITERPELDQYEALRDGWEYVRQTGRATSSELCLILWDGGPAFIDDIVLVKGTVAEQGENLVRNGNFEAPLRSEDWEIGSEFRRSQIVSSNVHGGQGAFLVMAEYSGDRQNLIRQVISPALVPNETYTISYWCYRFANRPNQFSMSLAGSSPDHGILNSPDDAIPLNTRIRSGHALPEDLRAWHVRRAVLARRQLLEVMIQFLDNHFVTGVTKSSQTFFGQVYDSRQMIYRACADAEINELDRWRAALLSPECTFHDLLKISIESPAMIIYLDTVFSGGGPGLIPNENFARELMELFTMGSDNGYDQDDVTAMAGVWTGWSVNLVDPGNERDPFAPMATNRIFGFEDNAPRNYIGSWTYCFLPQWHDPAEKILFHGKKVPDRFGPPYAGKSYALRLPARTGRSGMQDGYDAALHIANLPFTQEFMSVKLCRLFVHDDFEIGYDFTSSALTVEGRLVRACMDAWENSIPKGRIRDVLRVIFNSDLFRTKGAAFHKIKTPLEFTASAVRALRTESSDGTTAEVDGYASSPTLERMGRMMVFDYDSPDGTPESVVPLVTVSALAERIRFVQSLLCPPGSERPTEAGSSMADPVKLVQRKLPSAHWTDAEAVVGFFLETIYFGHGKASLQPIHDLALNFLNHSEDGQTLSNFSELKPGTLPYDTRVRGMVALLMSLFAFSQQ